MTEKTELQEIEKGLPSLVNRARECTVITENNYVNAIEEIKTCTLFRKKIIALHKPLKEATHTAHKKAVALEKSHLKPIEQAEQIWRQKTRAWKIEEDRKAREEAARQAEIARKDAEEKALKIAEALENSGMQEEAEEVISEPIVTAPIEIKEIPKIEGLSYALHWRWKYTDKSLIPREYLIIDEKKINGVVRAMKSETSIPGINVYSEKIERIRT